MSTLHDRFFRAGLVFFAVGIGLGIAMPIVSDFTLRPVHVHVNLLGFVAFFLYGFFYKLHPDAARSRLAVSHYWGSVVGLPPMMIGLGLVVYGLEPIGGPVLMAGELLVVVSVALFMTVVVRATRAPGPALRAPAPETPAADESAAAR